MVEFQLAGIELYVVLTEVREVMPHLEIVNLGISQEQAQS